MFSEAQELIVDRYKRPQFAGSLEEPKLQADGANQSCGDEVRIELRQEEGSIVAIRHRCRACAICSASADLLAEYFQGKEVGDIALMTAGEIESMLAIPLSPVRLKCALLPLETLRQALEQA